MHRLFILGLSFALIVVPLDRAGSAPTPKTSPTPKTTSAPKTSTLTKAQKAKAEQLKSSAPADEYFGRMKLSYLGIDNTFRDQAIRAGDHTINDDITGKVRVAEESLRAWRQKYPHDPQLARSIFLASRVDLKIWVVDFQQRAARYMIELRDKFSSTFFGKQTRAELHKGLTMHYYALPAPCVIASAGPSANPKPLASATPSANPSSSPPAIYDSKNNIKVNIIPVPCYTPAPSPTPSPSPARTVTPKATMAPSAAPSQSPQASPSPTRSTSPTPSPSPTRY